MWNQIVFDKSILIYIVIAGGITELLLNDKITSGKFSKKRYGAISCLVIAIVAAVVDALRTPPINWAAAVWKGLIAAALTTLVYSYVKLAIKEFVLKMFKGTPTES